jgi:hypothetical protein
MRVTLRTIAYDRDLLVQDTSEVGVAIIIDAHVFSPGLVNMAAPRNSGATKAGRLSVFLPFRQGDDDRTL